MDKEIPLISAIMLAGRMPIEYVYTAIESFKAQTYPYKELIIINNGKSQFENSSLNIHAQKDIFIIDTPTDLTAGMARNYGISAANGQILAQYDPDYYFSPNRLESQVRAISDNEVHACVLTETLQYSFISGRATYQQNDKNAILSTIVFIRPRQIDYPNIDKNEEKEFAEKFMKSDFKIVSLERPELACKIIPTRGTKSEHVTYNIDQHKNVIDNMLNAYNN